MIPVHHNPTPLPRQIPKGVSLVFMGTPPGGFTSGRNPHKKQSTAWVAFERTREENWNPWVWKFASFRAFVTFQAYQAAESDNG